MLGHILGALTYFTCTAVAIFQIISTYIEDVEALGGIGERNIDTLSKSISKNRRLNDQTLQLFLEPHIESLSLYDCSSTYPSPTAAASDYRC